MGDWSFAGGMRAHPELRSRYEILERLGEGTYGEVYKGKRKVDGLVVALKETRDTQSSSREAEALLALAGQPHVVKLIEFFLVEGSSLILVLEFLPSDLHQIIQASDRRIREAEVKGWILQLLRGVASCHQAGILHRDLKPSNLLVAADGALKVADFGQARIVVASNTGPAGVHITLQENEVKAGLNLEKESVDAWIEGTLTMKNGTELPAREMKGEARDVMINREEVDKEAVEKAEENGYGQCYCEEGDDTGRLDERNSSGNMIGCRSLNCSMIKRDGLIVARSNHFVEMEKKMEAVAKDEELGRREWVLAEKNMVGPPQEKDSDFFYKLRSFLKRRGRKPHKQNRWGKEKGSVETSQVILEEDGGRAGQYKHEYTTTVLHQSLHDNLSVVGPISDSLMRGNLEMWTDNISIKEADAMKSNMDNLEDMGLRPLIGNESTEEEILLRAIDKRETCTVEKSSKRSTFDLKESVHTYTYEPVVENPFDGTYISQTFGDSGRMIMNSSNHGHVGRDDLGSESKRRKAHELEKGIEETMSTELGGGAKCEPWGDGSKENLSPSNQEILADMETDTGLTELEAVRMRILYGKHRRTDAQKGEAPSLHSGGSINSTGHCELPVEPPALNSTVSPPTDSYLAKSKDVKVDGEETENAVCVLGLERIHNGIEGYIREVECAQEGSGACGPDNNAWKDTARFWDGNRQKWEPLNEASDEDRATEDQDNAKWYVGGCCQQMGVNGGFYNDSSYVEDRIAAYRMYGSAGLEDSDQEDDDPSGQTRWFRPPDVHDSYVKGKLEVYEEGSRSEKAIGYFGEDIEQSDHERLQEIEVHSQQEETESTYSGESGNKGSELSPCVGTRWYKGPELLYGATKYGKGLDMWAVGCIFAELLSGKPLFPGITDIDQLSRIVRVLGAAKESNWPGVSLLPDFDKISFSDERPLLSFQSLIPQASSSAVRFLEKLLVYDPERRLSAEAALRDIYFVEDPLPTQPQDLKVPSFRRDSSASEEWGEWRDPGSPFSDFEILDSAP